MKITVLHNQSFLDLAIQHTGNVTNAFAIANENNLSVAEALPAGLGLNVPEGLENDNDIYNYFSAKKIRPATEIIQGLIEVQPLEGISYWEIETEFEVQ